MEKIYPYVDIIILILVVIFLLFMFFRIIGRRIGLQKENTVEQTNTINIRATNSIKTVKKNASTSNDKELPLAVETFAEGSLNFKLEKVKKYDTDFSFKDFIKKCQSDFTNIVTSFNSGNLEKVKNLLTPKMYEGFNKYISDNNLNQNMEIERFLITDIIDVDFKDKILNIKVKFVTKQKINNETSEFREVWNFTKDIKSENKQWQLSQVLNG